ncbi:MAG: DUF3419 family protein [Gemmataceae bacterium]
MKIGDWISHRLFNLVHKNNLIYNTCWEDPRLDRQAMNLGTDDVVMVITSAGCNVLDYALDEPKHIFAVDMNPRQNALLELKIAGLRHLDFETFFSMFGKGQLPNYANVYQQNLREELSPRSQKYWDKRIKYFSGRGRRPSFYFHGTSGVFAWIINGYIDKVANVRDCVNELLAATTLEEQRELYHERLYPAFWKKFIRWAMNRDTTLSFLGVPRAQRKQIEKNYPGGVAKFVEDCIETVFTKLPIHDNYFWRVYLQGSYETDCCPEYLKQENFERLQGGLVDRVSVRTSSILDFLQNSTGGISRFVLLDHMDWLSTTKNQPILHQQWQAIVDKASANTRLLWRSGGLKVDFVDPIPVRVAGQQRQLGDVLEYQHELANELHKKDRVHTYGSFYIADLMTA